MRLVGPLIDACSRRKIHFNTHLGNYLHHLGERCMSTRNLLWTSKGVPSAWNLIPNFSVCLRLFVCFKVHPFTTHLLFYNFKRKHLNTLVESLKSVARRKIGISLHMLQFSECLKIYYGLLLDILFMTLASAELIFTFARLLRLIRSTKSVLKNFSIPPFAMPAKILCIDHAESKARF